MGEKIIASVFTDISIIMEQNDPIKSTIFTDKTTSYYLECMHLHLTFLFH